MEPLLFGLGAAVVLSPKPAPPKVTPTRALAPVQADRAPAFVPPDSRLRTAVIIQPKPLAPAARTAIDMIANAFHMERAQVESIFNPILSTGLVRIEGPLIIIAGIPDSLVDQAWDAAAKLPGVGILVGLMRGLHGLGQGILGGLARAAAEAGLVVIVTQDMLDANAELSR